MTTNPWERAKGLKRKYYKQFHDWDELDDRDETGCAIKRPKFIAKECNRYLDIRTKRAAIYVAPSVVALISYTGDEILMQGSGTIIESHDDATTIVLTSANLIRQHSSKGDGVAVNCVAPNLKVVVKLSEGRSFDGEVCAYDLHFNLAAVKFKSDSPLSVATLKRVDDSLHLNPSHQLISKSASFHPSHLLSSMVLTPGDSVIAVGRYFAKKFEVMAAPGQYSLERCGPWGYDCKELFQTTCYITRCGDGGPLINISGEVIGITFFDLPQAFFMPMNVVRKWWEHYKTYGELRQPSLGIDAINYYAAGLINVYKVIQKFPSISKGVYVEKVTSGSPACAAGLRTRDVIIECAGKVVQGFLELFEIIWDNVGKPVVLVVIRADHDTPLRLKPIVVEPTSDKLNSWPDWRNH